MTTPTRADRQAAMEQALANTRIEGHVPDAEFLADAQAVVDGLMTQEEARARSLARARARERVVEAAGQGG